ncbi:MAG TPA: glycosyltransferase family 4 protein [Candidatus Binataceae bacterium]|nr:glycosyltransferase family 4 protein [Candidatus Binataceae bacterium]
MTAAGHPRRLLTIGHSYCVALNRRLAHEMARAGGKQWEVTAVAPRFFPGDLRPIPLEPQPGELCRVAAIGVHLSRVAQLFFYGRGLRAVMRERWDLVHCWEEPYVIAGGQVALLSPAASKLVFYTFQNIAKRYAPPFSTIERRCAKRSAGWLASGETVAQTQLERCWSRKPHRVMPLGVDVELFRPDADRGRATRARLGWNDEGPPVVGFLGRFIEAKGLELLMRLLDETTSPWRALFVGGGPGEAALRAWASRHGDRVRIAGGVPHDRVPEYLDAMDLLLAPSQTTARWREQFGRMLIEAFACGVPVLASDSGEIPYVVGDAGLIVGERDELGWRRALADLLESPTRRAELAARGRDRAHALYSWPVVARRHLEFFDELLAT